jgi:hypothetical protein
MQFASGEILRQLAALQIGCPWSEATPVLNAMQDAGFSADQQNADWTDSPTGDFAEFTFSRQEEADDAVMVNVTRGSDARLVVAGLSWMEGRADTQELAAKKIAATLDALAAELGPPFLKFHPASWTVDESYGFTLAAKACWVRSGAASAGVTDDQLVYESVSGAAQAPICLSICPSEAEPEGWNNMYFLIFR